MKLALTIIVWCGGITFQESSTRLYVSAGGPPELPLVLPSETTPLIDTWCPNLADDITTCKASLQNGIQNLFYDALDVLNSATLLTYMLSTICAARTTVKNFYSCVYNKLTECVPAEWQKTHASVLQVLFSIDYLCQHVDNVDIDCIEDWDRFDLMENCVQQDISSETFDLSTSDGLLLYKCRIIPTHKKCYIETYGNCSKTLTGSVLGEYTQLHTPLACRACNTLSSSLLILTLLVLVYQYPY